MKAVKREVDAAHPLVPYPGKSCGGCSACCHTVPVKEIGVKAFTACPHLAGFEHRRPGCTIYPDRPQSCRIWSCSWLIGELGDEYRPDRLGIVMDPMPDLIRLSDGKEYVAAQFWVMPGHDDDWQKPRVLDLILSMIEDASVCVLWRLRGPDGTQMAHAFGKDETGRFWHTEPSPSNEQMSGYSETDRLLKAQQLAGNTTA